MSNSVNLSLDVTKTGIQNPLIKVRQGDGGFETLHTTVTSNGEPLDLQGWTITFMGTTAGNHKIVDGNVKIVEAPNGIFDYTPSKVWGMDIGDFKMAYFKFVKGDGSASSANFRVSVIEAVDITQEEAKNYISVVDTTIAEINQHLTESLANVTQSIADANNNANTVASNVTALGNRVDDYNNKLAAIKVGGRNLMLGTANWYGDSTRWEKRGTVSDNAITYRGMTVASTSGAWTSPVYKLQNAGILQVGKTYTFSTYARNTSDTDTKVGMYYDLAIVTQHSYSVALPAHTDWNRISVTFKVLKDPTTSTQGLRWEGQNTLTNGQIQFAGYKLEEGNVPTDWTPAPEDAPSNDAQLVHKTGTETVAGDKTFTSPINGQLSGNAATATKWQTARTLALTGDITGSVAMDGSGNVSMATTGTNLVHKEGNETIAGDKTFTGVSTLTNIKSSSVKTASVALGGMTINFRQTIAGVNVYISGSFQTNFGPSDDYIANSNGVPSSIGSPRQNVVLTIIGNSGISGVTSNAPFKLEVLIGTDGTIKYRAKNLLANDTASHNVAIIGAASTFYSLD